MITCKTCNETKAKEEFSFQDSTYTKRRKKCKKCHAAEMKETNYGKIVPKKSIFNFDPLLDYFMAVHAREALKCRRQSIVMGAAIVAAHAKGGDDEYCIEEFHTVSRTTCCLYGHPAGVRYA